VADDLGEHVELTNPSCDQLGVLSAEVDDQDGGTGGLLRLTQDCES
jgi:hypothetical protein